jgi:hypothetical protein
VGGQGADLEMAVDVKLWVIPDLPDPADALRNWLSARLRKKPAPARGPDVAHEPVILIWPRDRQGDVVWDPRHGATGEAGDV